MSDYSNYPLLEDRNRRTYRRRATRVRAWADPGGVAPVVDCLVTDVSEGGASVVAIVGGELAKAQKNG